jgi:hypothetical protein
MRQMELPRESREQRPVPGYPTRRATNVIALTGTDVMWNFYSSIAIGGVLLMAAPPKELKENDTIVYRVAFMLTWPMSLLIDLALEYRRNRRNR